MKKPIRLLYLEDDELDRRAFFHMVREKELPYEVTSAMKIAEARARLAESEFDVIVADYHLPDGDCTELFEAVPGTPFILLTGTLEEQLALRTLEIGADDYLPKDTHNRHLEAVPLAVEKTLHRKRIREAERRLTKELRRSEERFRLMVKDVKDHAIFLLDPEGRVTTWNAGAQSIQGYTAEEILGKHFSCFYLPADIAVDKPQRVLALAAEQGEYTEERWRLREDGSRFWASTTTTAVRDAAGELRGFAEVTRDITAAREEAQARLIQIAEERPQTEGKNRLHQRLVRLAQGAAAVTALIGAGHLAAWLGGVMAERGFSTITMKTNTALCLLLMGVALALVVPTAISRARRWAGRACAAFALLIGALTLSENLVGWDFGIDQLLAREPAGAIGVNSPNRMGTPASAGIVLAGLALLILSRSNRRGLPAAQALALSVVLIALLTNVGFLYGSSDLYAIAGFTTIAWPTALALLVLGVGLLCARPEAGFMAQVTATDAGGTTIRRLLIPILLLPLALGWLHLAGEQAGLFDPPMGTALLTLIFIVAFSGLAYRAGRDLSRFTAAERAAHEALRQSEDRFRSFMTHSPAAAWIVDADGYYRYVNPRYYRIFPVPSPNLVGKHIGDIYPETVTQYRLSTNLRVLNERQVLETIEQGPRADGSLGQFLVTRFPIAASRDKAMVGGIALDITERRHAEEALRESETRYRTLFNSIDEGFCIIEVIFGENGKPIDLRFLQTNPSFARQTGLVDAQGKTVRELAPNLEEHWLGTYGRIALTGQPARFQNRAEPLHRWFDVYAFRFGQAENRQVAVVFNDITERKRAEEELAAAKISAERAMGAAEQANRAKDHFLAVLSHELRTPLTPVAMAVSMLQDRAEADDDMRETLEMIRRNVELEAMLIDDLLDVSRIARGKLELNRSPVELCTVISRAVEVCQPDIEARRLEFGVDMGPAAPYWIEADASRLQQVFWNLLKNAVKFTPHGGCVGIRCRPYEKYVVAEVNDSGIGIEPEALSRVFNAFEQAERSITLQFGGLGLGLAISKALVEMHGGTISAHSEGRDKGATFRVRLPLTVPAGTPEVPAPAAPPQRAVRPLRILLVEDHGITAKITRIVLAAEGHTVETAGDVATALELAGEQPFDLLLSDLGLPDGSGHDLMRQLRQRGHKFPGIALSGYGQEEDIQRSYEAGFIAHLTKPASREAVVEAVEAIAADTVTPEEPPTPATEPRADSVATLRPEPPVFDLNAALQRCGDLEMLQEMVECFYCEVDDLFPQMRAALDRGDLAEVGRLGHRMKGTVVYLGAQPAKKAALRVEQFSESSGGPPSEAEEAVKALEQACKALKAALAAHGPAIN